MADHHGKIDFELACRFDELTRNEIRVLVYLYACRNEETKQCNPSRRKIISDINIEKGNLSKAVGELERKGFIVEFESGDFELISAENIVNPDLEKVVKSPTVVNSPTQKVVDSPTKVVNLTTKSCRFTNSNKETEQRRNREGTEKSKIIGKSDDSPELKNFRKNLSDFQNEYAKPTTQNQAIANNQAIRKLFHLARGDTELCKEVHYSLQCEAFRNGRVDWTTVVKNFNFHQAKRKNDRSSENKTNGNGSKPAEKADPKSTGDTLAAIGATAEL